MKLTTQTAAVAITAIIGTVGLFLGLAIYANWSDGAIVGMVTAFAALFANQIVSAYKRTKQDEKLDTITEQTNGLSFAERQDIADRAAVAAVQRYRDGGL